AGRGALIPGAGIGIARGEAGPVRRRGAHRHGHADVAGVVARRRSALFRGELRIDGQRRPDLGYGFVVAVLRLGDAAPPEQGRGDERRAEPCQIPVHSTSSVSPSTSLPAADEEPNPYCLTSCERRGRFMPKRLAALVMFPPVSASARAMQSRSMSRLRSLRL